MSKLSDVAYYVRSKNADPFWVTIDIFCNNEESYKRIASSKNINKQLISKLYGAAPENVKIFHMDDLKVIKISYPRFCPQGGKDGRDMHAGQQYRALLNVEI